jgi:hypothetical protein
MSNPFRRVGAHPRPAPSLHGDATGSERSNAAGPCCPYPRTGGTPTWEELLGQR